MYPQVSPLQHSFKGTSPLATSPLPTCPQTRWSCMGMDIANKTYESILMPSRPSPRRAHSEEIPPPLPLKNPTRGSSRPKPSHSPTGELEWGVMVGSQNGESCAFPQRPSLLSPLCVFPQSALNCPSRHRSLTSLGQRRHWHQAACLVPAAQVPWMAAPAPAAPARASGQRTGKPAPRRTPAVVGGGRS